MSEFVVIAGVVAGRGKGSKISADDLSGGEKQAERLVARGQLKPRKAAQKKAAKPAPEPEADAPTSDDEAGKPTDAAGSLPGGRSKGD